MPILRFLSATLGLRYIGQHVAGEPAMNGYERIHAMMTGDAVDCLPLMPITMMFAADVAGVRYGQYAADHRVLVEAQLRTAERFGFDYVSCISDPTREAADCGAAIQYFDDQPPAIDEVHAVLEDKSALTRLKVPNPLGGGRMHDRVKAAALFRQRVGGRLLIEGWIEGPCAEAADLRGINRLMLDFYDDPSFVRDLFDFILEMELAFARAQIEAGVDLIGIGDAAASLAGPRFYEEFIWPYEKKMVDAIHEMGARVRLHICGNINPILNPIGRLGCDIVDLDFMVPVADARRAMGPDQVLLGNIDPVRVLRNGTPESVSAAVSRCHDEAGSKYIVGPGCEVPRQTPHANLEALTRYARSHQP
ncbi:MAG TPA: uroporphyrinogen decarboxylase [Planctomycetaceae bacterium]|nr:uroporphyrinogen decarboxylase [Planctomycetaceae bacterium]